MVAFASRRPDLHIILPIDEETGFSSRLQGKIERKVASDAKFLPRSTNMGLPANATTGVKYNFEEDGSPQIKSLPPQSLATFKRAIPSFSVTHIPTALPWYKEVLGFAVVGAADAGRAELHRAEPGARKGEGGVSLYLRKAAADEPVPKGSLWIEVDSVDNLYAELSYKMEKYAQDLSNYFPPHHFGSSKILAKPRNTSWGQREMTCVDAGGNSIVFFQVL